MTDSGIRRLLLAVDSDGHAVVHAGGTRSSAQGAFVSGPGAAPVADALAWLRSGCSGPAPVHQGFAIAESGADGTTSAAVGSRAEIALYWAESHGGLILATRPSDLIALLPAPPPVDPEVIADLVALHDDPRRTPFLGVHRLPLGHRLEWMPSAPARVTRWFDPRPAPRHPLPGEDAIAMREVVRAAVRDSLPDDDAPIAATLSAGLDSTMVVATAASLVPASRIHAATHRPLEGTDDPDDGWAADDGPLARAFARELRLGDWTALRNDSRRTPLEALLRAFPRTWLPLLNPANAVWIEDAAAWSTRLGAAVLLTGSSGNGGYSPDGSWVPGQLVGEHRPRALLRLVLDRRRSGRGWGDAVRPAVRALTPERLRALTRRARRRDDAAPALLVVERFRTPDRVSRFRRRFSSLPLTREQWRDELLLRDGMTLTAPLGGGDGPWWSDPLGDDRVVELALALPASSWTWGGLTRSLARRASAGLVTDDIRLRRTLGAQAADLGRWLEGHEQLYRDAIDWIASSSAGVVLDVEALRASIASGFPLHPAEAIEWESVHGRALGFGLFVAWYETTVLGQSVRVPASIATLLATESTESP